MTIVKLAVLLILCGVTYGVESDGDFLLRAEVRQSAAPPPPPEMLVYDDGSPVWLSWSGTNRGVWFDLEDFIPDPTNYYLLGTEMWFYRGRNRSVIQ